MVAIGLLVNWSVLDVCIFKCGHIFVVCVYGGVSTWTLHACYHVAKRLELVTKARCTGTGLAGQDVSCLWLNRSCSPPIQPSHLPDLERGPSDQPPLVRPVVQGGGGHHVGL